MIRTTTPRQRTQPRPNSPRSVHDTFGAFVTAHPGELIATLSAAGYLLGYVNARLAAAGLGVSPDDLSLSTNDHLLAAAAYALFFASFLLGYPWLRRLVRTLGWASLTGKTTVVAAGGVAVSVVVTSAATLGWRGAVLTAFGIGLAAAAGWWIGGIGLSVVLTAAVTVAGFGPPASYEWGRELRKHPDSAPTPVWLELVLSVEPGTARFRGGAECVVRVSDRVYVSIDGVRIEPVAVPFQPDECFSP